MNLVWQIKLYHISEKSGYKVKLHGNPRRVSSPWVIAEGKGNTPMAALKAAMEEMSASDQASLRLLIDPQAP